MAKARCAYALIRLAFTAALALGPSSTLHSQDSRDFQQLEEEAPEALFETQIGDQEVDFYLFGSWNMGIAGGVGFALKPDGGIAALDSFPALTKGFLFQQQPDLTFSVWLMQRYFFEFSVLGSFDRNSFLVGYQGQEGDLLQRLALGNRGVGIDPYPYISIPDTGDSSLGIEAELSSGASTHQLLLRYDNNGRGKKVFIGKNEVAEELVPLSSYMQGRYFKLPDSQVTGLELYLEDSAGPYTGTDGRQYRKADFDDAFIDSQAGLVELKQERKGRVLVFYRKAGNDVGDAALGTDALADVDDDVDVKGLVDPFTKAKFDWTQTIDYLNPPNTMGDRWRITLNSKDCLLLWEPGIYSHFDILASYPLPLGTPSEPWRTRVSLIRKGSLSPHPEQPLRFRIFPAESRFEAYVTEDLRNDLANLYPLLELSAPTIDGTDPLDHLYGPYRETAEGNYGWQLLVQTFQPVVSYSLEPGLLPGSVRVTRGEEEETRFEVDYETGVITFSTPILSSERIEVSYQREGALVDNGDILFAWGNTLPLAPALDLTAAMGFRWNALPGAYSDPAYSRTGAVVASAGLEGSTEKLAYRMDAGFSYANPDTTGTLRLMGMEEAGIEVDLSEDLAYPSGVPDSTLTGMASVTGNNRGELTYKDYRSYSLLGFEDLQDLSWDLPPEQNFAYATGSQPGPYNVEKGPLDDTRLLAMDFSLSGEHDWVGFQIPVLPGQGIVDLSGLESLFLAYRAVDIVQETGTPDFDIYLHLGEIDEDIDDDDVLDRESSIASSGFLFNDGGLSLLVGGGPELQGNHRLDSEDWDGNHRLDPEDTENIFEALIASSISADTTWNTFKDHLSNLDADYYKKLKRVRGLRIIIIQKNAGAISGKLLLETLRFSGSSFGVLDSASGTVRSREILEESGSSAPPRKLEAEYPEVGTTFHPNGEPQKVLEIDWAGCDTGETWNVRGYAETGTLGARYRELVLYMRLPNASDAPSLQFHLRDENGRGVHWGFQPASTFSDWRELRVNIEDGDILLGGSVPNGGFVTADPGRGSLQQFSISMTGSASGTLYVDELHLESPIGSFGGSIDADLTLNMPGVLLSLRDVPLVADLALSSGMRFVSPGFSSLYGFPSSVWGTSLLSEVSSKILFTQVDLYFLLQGRNADFSLSGGHSMGLPLWQNRLNISDAYDLQSKAGGFEFSRGNALRIAFPNLGSLHLASTSFSRESLLRQEWTGEVALGPPGWPILGARAEFSETSSEYVHLESWYLPSWILGYRFLVPWGGTLDLQRDAELEAGLSLDPRPAGFEIDMKVGYQSGEIGSASRVQQDRLEYGVKLPMQFSGPAGLNFSPGYRRVWSGESQASEPGGVFLDVGHTWDRLMGQPYLINQIPVWEFFAEALTDDFEAETAGFLSAAYHPQLSLSFSRYIQSHWSSLVLPTLIDLRMGKSHDKSGDLYQYLMTYELRCAFNAINLFGRYGAYSLFSAYDLDEFSSVYNVEIKTGGSAVVQQSYHMGNSIIFEREDGNSLLIQHSADLSHDTQWLFRDEATGAFQWVAYPKEPITFPFLSEEITQKGFFQSEESVSLEWRNRQADSAVHVLTAVFGHQTTLRFPQHGYLRAGISIGYDLERVPVFGGVPPGSVYESWHRFALEARLEGKIQF